MFNVKFIMTGVRLECECQKSLHAPLTCVQTSQQTDLVATWESSGCFIEVI